MFSRIGSDIANFDFSVFFNANTLFVKYIGLEEFFGKEKELVAAIHPGYYNKSKNVWPYEIRPASCASIMNKVHYFQGAINGGKSTTFISISKDLSKNIDKDLEKGIVAQWHDESHWNAYLNNNFESMRSKINILAPSYIYPEGWKLPFDVDILLRDKKKYGGHESLRSMEQTKISSFSKISNKIKILLGDR
jgi:hypothetical protein